MYKVKFNKDFNRINVYNISHYLIDIRDLDKYEIEYQEYNKVLKDLGLNILIPSKDSEDFICKYIGTSYFKDILYENEKDLIGRSFGDLFPFIKDNANNLFKRVLKRKKKEIVNIFFYENNLLEYVINVKLTEKDNEIYFFLDKTLMNKEAMLESKTYVNALQIQDLYKTNVTVRDMQTATSISIHYVTPNGEYVWSPEVYNIIERNPRPTDRNNHIILELVDDEQKNHIQELLDNLEPNEFLGDQILTITLENGNKKHIKVNSRNLYDAEGKFIQRNGYVMDITSQVEYEKTLIQSDENKTLLIQEIHHRIKNNLQVIKSLISLEERYKANNKEIIEITKTRIGSLALIHENMYNEHNMKGVTLNRFINDLDNELNSISPLKDISFKNNVPEIVLSVDILTPIVLIINELTTNSFKHAFDEVDNKEISKSFELFEKDNKQFIRFTYKDNGKGLNDDFDIDSSSTLGMTIIKSLSNQLDGEFKIFNDNGFCYEIIFPLHKT